MSFGERNFDSVFFEKSKFDVFFERTILKMSFGGKNFDNVFFEGAIFIDA